MGIGSQLGGEYAKKLQAEKQAYAQDMCTQANQVNTCEVREQTRAEQHESAAKEYERVMYCQKKAAAFFHEHPEFAEFLTLVQSGVVSLY